MQFFNPKLSTVSFGVSVLRGTMQVSMAKTSNPNFQGRPQKGQKMYDWENTVYFSLQPSEVMTILENWNAIMDGTYVNQREQNQKFKNQFSITHFRDNQPSRLIVSRSLDQNNNPTGSFMLTLLPPQGSGNPVSYVLRPPELKEFRFYLENCARYLNFLKDVFDGIEKAKRFQNNQNNQNNQNSQSGGGQQNSGGYDNQGGQDYGTGDYNNPYEATFDHGGGNPNPAPAQNNQNPNPAGNQNQGGPNTQNVSSVDQMNFNW